MPEYLYKRKAGEAPRTCGWTECPNCDQGFRAFQKLADEPLHNCPTCEAPVYRAIQAAQVRIREYSEYREDLARHPGDPQANVSSKIGLAKLVQQRQREGWGDPKSVDESDRMGQNAPKLVSRVEAREMARKAVHEAGL